MWPFGKHKKDDTADNADQPTVTSASDMGTGKQATQMPTENNLDPQQSSSEIPAQPTPEVSDAPIAPADPSAAEPAAPTETGAAKETGDALPEEPSDPNNTPVAPAV